VGVIAPMVLAALLGAPKSEWKPAPAPPPTVWARAGARGWTLCEDVERQASILQTADGRGPSDDAMWANRAQQCPHVPPALVLAAQYVLGETGPLEPEIGDLQRVFVAHRKRTRRALGWIEAAIAESNRRAETPPLHTRYYRAYALVALGRYDEAAAALRSVVETGDVERWRADRMRAVVEVMRGNLDLAHRLAHRGTVDAPSGQDKLISRYMEAYVIDRVGAPAEAEAELRRLRREAGSTSAAALVLTVLPMHERLYLRALDHQANAETSNAMRLWDAYLSRPEPAEADKELARRHRTELEPRAAPVGGPLGG
jgi:tetratricopeptide (TPR) repeat protein